MSTVAMLPGHARIFQAAARHFNVFILVRRTNLASLRFIGNKDCVPKRIDCKAKTADTPVTPENSAQIDCAGLVVDPTLLGQAAFASDKKYQKALDEWARFSMSHIHERVRTLEEQQSVSIIPDGKQYFVDLDRSSPRYGCLKYTQGHLTTGKYIHGDFDLYGIVPADDRRNNVAVFETLLGQKHSRSPAFRDVQIFVNSRIGAPMILHGEQDTYAEDHSDEGIDVFEPDGSISGCENLAQIEWLYAIRFRGRKLFTRSQQRHFGYDGNETFEGFKWAL